MEDKVEQEEIGTGSNPLQVLRVPGGRNILDVPKAYGFGITCPKCKTKLRFQDWQPRVVCLKCGHPFEISLSNNPAAHRKTQTIQRGQHDRRRKKIEEDGE